MKYATVTKNLEALVLGAALALAYSPLTQKSFVALPAYPLQLAIFLAVFTNHALFTKNHKHDNYIGYNY